MANLTDKTENELLARLEQLTTQLKNSQPDEKEALIKKVEPLAKRYYELTGRHYVYSAIRWAADRKS